MWGSIKSGFSKTASWVKNTGESIFDYYKKTDKNLRDYYTQEPMNPTGPAPVADTTKNNTNTLIMFGVIVISIILLLKK